jgi:hypothetical protein
MQIPILNGIYTDSSAEMRVSYPVNLAPVPTDSGISKGYLSPADGLVSNGLGPGIDRGGIEWRGVCYRVMGSKLVTVLENGTVTILGDVGTGGLVTFDYSFDRLIIASGGRLYYYFNNTLSQVTDPDLGIVLDTLWVDGYTMTTDGEFLVVTELNDPFAVNPLKYGSSEIDPDPIKAIWKLRNEVYALNRHTIEVFDNVGGELFPFQRIEGAQIEKGTVGTHACCIYLETIAFLGSGRNESPGVYLGANATAQKISTHEIDRLLLNYTEAQLSEVKLEARNDKSHQYLYMHLPDQTLVYDSAASQALQQPVWFVLTSSIVNFSQYRARNLVWAYNKWLCGDPLSNNVGYLAENISSHYGQQVRWEFGTSIAYNEGNGAIFNRLELVALTGRIALGKQPRISTSYSIDGLSWSQEKAITAGQIGNTTKRLVWFQQGFMRNMRMQRFKGDSDAFMSFARLDAQIEPLVY